MLQHPSNENKLWWKNLIKVSEFYSWLKATYFVFSTWLIFTIRQFHLSGAKLPVDLMTIHPIQELGFEGKVPVTYSMVLKRTHINEIKIEKVSTFKMYYLAWVLIIKCCTWKTNLQFRNKMSSLVQLYFHVVDVNVNIECH